MPHTSDLGQNIIWEGNNGEKWQVVESLTSPDKIHATLERLKVEEIIINEQTPE